VRGHLAPALIGQDPRDVTRLEIAMHRALPHHEFSSRASRWPSGTWPARRSACRCGSLLGGRVRAGVDLMGFVDHDEPARMAAAAARTLDATPFRVLKMKIGMDPDGDVARVRAVAEAVRGRAVLQVDGNTGYTLPRRCRP
jgi:L-Ala-D/L-Glu epimerase